MKKKHALITGSSRGIGFGLATEFLKNGYNVTISGTTEASTKSAYQKLINQFSSDNLFSQNCNVTKYEEVENLWNAAFQKFGQIDIWVNNAGVGQANKYFWEMQKEAFDDIIDINIKGMMYGTKIAFENMQKQGFGAIYNMEGFGSDGRKMKKLTVYGTSKKALNYFTESFIKEAKETNVILGLLSPGMVMTDLLTDPIDENSPERKQFVKIVNILGDKVETVTPFLVKGMINNQKNGKAIRWLTTTKATGRFFMSLFRKRKLIE
ncbi:MAG: SDR family NAD(P)-dependent oxidoreductase [Bacteroidales bacterium]|jgi:NAD(P)-dependent dehydrogenase (short-subunit alcohol dehydrogenase family)|nr:SDR family NAD(P)-dependent oxidoreductase [Bacteroidales bacterium]